MIVRLQQGSNPVTDEEFWDAYSRIVWDGTSLVDSAREIADHNRRAAEKYDKSQVCKAKAKPSPRSKSTLFQEKSDG